MLGIEDYGSDAESGDESSATTTFIATPLVSKLPPPTSKSTFALPPPKSSSSSSPSLPPPGSTSSSSTAAQPKPKRIKKIAIDLPSLPPLEDADADDAPPTKKPRIAPSAGAGSSSLLGMLPAPKHRAPIVEKKEERVLGGGSGPGLVFRTSQSEARTVAEGSTDVSGSSTSFLPPSLKKGSANISLENPGPSKLPIQPPKLATPSIDFFSLGSSTPPAKSPSKSGPVPAVSSLPSTSTSASPSFTVSSAPTISTFRPPSPTLDDPYPGYYQLPSGAYAPYDAGYYASYAQKWKAEYDKHIRALEKSQHEPETDGSQDIDMAAEMEKARREVKEREDRKALTTGMAGKNEDGEVPMPKMNVKGAKLGSVARSRHQLTTLLTEAYLNREALEEKIAQGRRNRKEAGNKYGF